MSEGRITRTIDRWLEDLFDADHIDQTVANLPGAASGPDPVAENRHRIAQARVEDCDARLRRFRAALNDDNGAVIGGWIAETMREREAAPETWPTPHRHRRIRAYLTHPART